MSDIIVYMKPDASQTGKQHEHNNVTTVVRDLYLKVSYVHSRVVVCYPLTSIERWEVR